MNSGANCNVHSGANCKLHTCHCNFVKTKFMLTAALGYQAIGPIPIYMYVCVLYSLAKRVERALVLHYVTALAYSQLIYYASILANLIWRSGRTVIW